MAGQNRPKEGEGSRLPLEMSRYSCGALNRSTGNPRTAILPAARVAAWITFGWLIGWEYRCRRVPGFTLMRQASRLPVARCQTGHRRTAKVVRRIVVAYAKLHRPAATVATRLCGIRFDWVSA